jgi:hypothetical protein
MTINEKIKVIDKDISDFSVDRTKRDWREIKIDWTMTNNLLIEETPRRIDQGHGNRQIHRFTNLTKHFL